MMEPHGEAWLMLTKEDPIDPDLPICDPHHHLWDYPDDFPENRVPTYARHQRHFLLKESLEDVRGYIVFHLLIVFGTSIAPHLGAL
jgi:hypothetical protein